MLVAAALNMRLTRLPVFGQSLGNPLFQPAFRFL
jgi:hypothetical protein